MTSYSFADLHCHPTLKTYAHSAIDKDQPSADLWNYKPPGVLEKAIHILTGIAKYSQTDFTTLVKGKVRIAVVSLYPIEKGFVINTTGKGLISSAITRCLTHLSYKRIKYLQGHTDYYQELYNEYEFLLSNSKNRNIGNTKASYKLARQWKDVKEILLEEDSIAVIITIEGAHVFNTGLTEYGREINEEEILSNIYAVKQWQYPPFFITFAHNFNNDLCGHARSLEVISRLVNQNKNLDTGFSDLGKKAIHALLDNTNGKRVFIDIKHMSLAARLEYYEILKTEYPQQAIPIVVSHGAVTGRSISREKNTGEKSGDFLDCDINFFDEEIVIIAKSNGVFAVQMDCRRLATKRFLQRSLIRGIVKQQMTKQAACIVWNQLEHIAVVLDKAGLFAWGTATIGSDLDGSINQLKGVWTCEQYPFLAEELVKCAEHYLEHNCNLSVPENRNISGEEIVERFIFKNAAEFLQRFF